MGIFSADMPPLNDSDYPENKADSAVLAQTKTKELTRRGKMTAFTLVVIGLLTFVIPTIKFDPPVQDRQYWSVLDMLRRPETKPKAETLFPSSLLVVSIIPFEWIYVIYAVLFVSMGAILLFPFRKLLIGIGMAGLACLVLSFGGLFGLVRFIMSPSFQSSQGGDLKILWASFAAVLVALTISAWADATT